MTGAVTVFSRGSFGSEFRLSATMHVSRERDEVFCFFSDPANLESITPPWLRFKIVTERPIHMGDGTLIDYKLRVHGLPLKWRSRIADWRPPCEFVDEQVLGPYRLWRHWHHFEEDDNGTLIHDSVDYQVYGGWLIDRMFVRRDLERIFHYRQDRITELLSSHPADARDRTVPGS